MSPPATPKWNLSWRVYNKMTVGRNSMKDSTQMFNYTLNIIKTGSVVAWQHINLQGEYDFSEEVLRNSIEFKLPELLDLQVV